MGALVLNACRNIQAGGIVPHAFLKGNEACGIVSLRYSIVNEEDMHFARSMHADSVRHFDVAGARGTRDEDRRF